MISLPVCLVLLKKCLDYTLYQVNYDIMILLLILQLYLKWEIRNYVQINLYYYIIYT